MSNSEVETMKNKISVYYREHFDINPLMRLINYQPIHLREFGYESFEKRETNDPTKQAYYFYRNINVNNPIQFIDWITNLKPRKLYLGAQYKTPIQRNIENTEWDSTNLKFDIDLDDAEFVRNVLCDCSGKQMCDKCFEIAKEAAIYLVEVLNDDFANPRFPCYKSEAMFVLSGTKGIHIHYPKINRVGGDHTTMSKEEEYRRHLVDYIKMINVTKEHDEQPLYDKFVSKSLEKHFERMIVKWFFTKIPLEKLTEMNWFMSKKNKRGFESYSKGRTFRSNELTAVLNKIKQDYNTNANLVLNKSKISGEYGIHYETLFNNILVYRYPRYDGVITYDLKRLIKVPWSVDGNTGRIVQEITYNQLHSIKLSDLLTVDSFL